MKAKNNTSQSRILRTQQSRVVNIHFSMLGMEENVENIREIVPVDYRRNFDEFCRNYWHFAHKHLNG